MAAALTRRLPALDADGGHRRLQQGLALGGRTVLDGLLDQLPQVAEVCLGRRCVLLAVDGVAELFAAGVQLVDALLELAGIAAHASERTAAPITCWIAAVAGLAPADALRLAASLPAD